MHVKYVFSVLRYTQPLDLHTAAGATTSDLFDLLLFYFFIIFVKLNDYELMNNITSLIIQFFLQAGIPSAPTEIY